ncbi:MAG: peptidase T [Desulfobacterales bacterium CG07_land_8_20_14_0_80_52_14]|nr:MAG: peptidase T [Desulfobacterales bacterium CG23_combo_of_CG06-09_8_20_14_all_52_9]PIU48998.1 MAG: peptidase T [Desulfobacterales bacterium CG07_land_8_20_14_0_80_52_14]
MIHSDRLKETFLSLVKIGSVSKKEGAFSRMLQGLLKNLGAFTRIDDAGKTTGSDTGNLIAKFSGNRNVPPLLLSAHMDTVQPGEDIHPVYEDGVFKSDGRTILGADDKSAIAILLESIRVIQENGLPCGPLELVFTVCEEDALAGSKRLDLDHISAKYGFVLDATDTEGIVTRAPAANRLTFDVFGKEAHAGAAPEKGINAIHLACRAIASLEIGRVDRETTCNIGVIQGGFATNIVPNRVTVIGEARSHDEAKLKRVTETIVGAFKESVEHYAGPASGNGLPRLESRVERSFSRTYIPQDHPVVLLARNAAETMGRKMVCKSSGGGSDANIFFEKGIATGVLGTGMRDIHTVLEWVRLDDMVRMSELLVKILTLHADTTFGS